MRHIHYEILYGQQPRRKRRSGTADAGRSAAILSDRRCVGGEGLLTFATTKEIEQEQLAEGLFRQQRQLGQLSRKVGDRGNANEMA